MSLDDELDIDELAPEKRIKLMRLHDDTFAKLAAALKCSRQDVHNKLAKWAKQTEEIKAVILEFEQNRSKLLNE